jgi:uncharacterized protein (DUF1501 family)
MPKPLSRRRFIGQASCAALGSTTLLSSLASLMGTNKLMSTSLEDPGDYKALICILLAGGNDSFNMLVPRGESEYAEYAATRTDLALPRESLLPIDAPSQSKQLGIHPSMSHVHQLYQQGNLAFMTNVGTLVEPISSEQEFRSGLKKLPLGIYSHSDQIQQWQTAIPQSREAIGWGGRMADLLQETDTNTGISMNISLSGRNVFQSGQNTLEYSISNRGNGVQGVEGYSRWDGNQGFLTDLRDGAYKNMVDRMYANVFEQTVGSLTSQTLESIESFETAIQQVAPFTTTFGEHYLSQNMRMVARTIAANSLLGNRRQTFFMTFGGWDHHNEVLNNQEYMLGVVSRAIGDLYTALGEIGLEEKVTTFTISDFARTLTSNGNGSDHAWGGNAIVAGGAVNGGDVYGDYPDLYVKDNPLMVSRRGNLIPTTAADEFFAELILWFGVSPNDLSIILPNINNFYSPNSRQAPLGFIR